MSIGIPHGWVVLLTLSFRGFLCADRLRGLHVEPCKSHPALDDMRKDHRHGYRGQRLDVTGSHTALASRRQLQGICMIIIPAHTEV